MSQEIVGPLTVTSPLGVQGGSLELGATLGATPETPYVDFHFGTGAAQDFNVRLINPANNHLDVVTEVGGPVLSVHAENIGIGTTSPAAKLVVNQLAGGAEVRVDGDNGLIGLSLGADAAQPWVGTRTNHALRLLTNNTEQVRVQANGNVGIGTPAPAQKLEVVGTVKATAFQGNGAGLTGVSGTDPTRVAKTGDTMSGALVITAAGAGLRVTRDASVGGTLTVTGNLGIRTSTPEAPLHIRGGADATPTSGGYLIVGSTSGANVVLDENEIMARTNRQASGLHLQAPGGNLLIHTQAPGRVGIGTANPNFTLDVRGTIGNNTTQYHSDLRWKKNVETIAQALDKILQLRGVRYEWKSEEYVEMRFDQKVHIGVIGQEVEKIIPEVVHTDENGYKTVEYANLIAVCIEAIKALNAENHALKQRLQNLETRLEVPI